MSNIEQNSLNNRLATVSKIIFLGILAYIPFHVLVANWIGSSFGQLELAKAIKDPIMLLGFALAIYTEKNNLKKYFVQQKLLFLAIFVYFFITCLSAIVFANNQNAKIIGTVYNLRFFCFFIYATLMANRYPVNLKKRAVKIVLIAGVIVSILGVFQVVLLPNNALTHIGFTKSTGSQPVFYIHDDIKATERASSSIKDPNALGAYLLIIIALALAYLYCLRQNRKKWILKSTILMPLILCLYLTYSRSAWVGLVVGAGFLIFYLLSKHKNLTTSFKKYSPYFIVVLTLALVLLNLGITKTKQYKSVVLHNERNQTVDSNTKRLGSYKESISIIKNYLVTGTGVGSAGPVSFKNTPHQPVISENYYLQIAIEVGLIGLALFIFITLNVAVKLYVLSGPKNPYALVLLVSLLAVSASNMFNHNWANEAVAYTWWGLAGLYTAKSTSKNGWRAFINWNRHASQKFDNLFVGKSWRVDGLKDYINNIVPSYLKPNQVVYDIGGGKRPFVGTEVAKQKGVTVVGVDIDKQELTLAPYGVYSYTVVGDIGSKELKFPKVRADIVISQAVLEHVQNNKQAAKNISLLTKSGGTALIYLPSRNALFARINLLIPEKIKRAVLYGIYPEFSYAQGFPAYYNLCTPKQMERLFEQNGFSVLEVRKYHYSPYFSFFLPLYIVWRCYQAVLAILGIDHSECFSIVAVKN